MPALNRRQSLALLTSLPALALLPRGASADQRPESWAQPVTLPGVPNLFQVTPTIFRSAQPDAAGFQAMPALEIATVINLRRRVDDAPIAAGTGIDTLHIKVTTRHLTDDNSAAIATALRALQDRQRHGPVLVHCTHGADRTGLVIALWRMLHQGWSRADALDELQNGGFGFHPVWVNIPRYVETVDLQALRTRIDGLPAA